MAKKEKIAINRSERLSEIDADLDTAMERVDETNVRIDEVLKSFDLPEGGAEDLELGEDGAETAGGEDLEDEGAGEDGALDDGEFDENEEEEDDDSLE